MAKSNLPTTTPPAGIETTSKPSTSRFTYDSSLYLPSSTKTPRLLDNHKHTKARTSMIHRGVLWCDLRLVEPQDGWILAVGVLIRPGCPGGCRFHCGGLLVLSVGRWFGGYWGQPGWRDQMRVQALTRSSAQAQSSGSFKIW